MLSTFNKCLHKKWYFLIHSFVQSLVGTKYWSVNCKMNLGVIDRLADIY